MTNKQMLIGLVLAAIAVFLGQRFGYASGETAWIGSMGIPAEVLSYVAGIAAFFSPKLTPYLKGLNIPSFGFGTSTKFPAGSLEEATSHISALKQTIGSCSKADKALKDLMDILYEKCFEEQINEE